MSQEKTQQREGMFCQDQKRGCSCAEWPNEQQKDYCIQEDCFFKGNIAKSVLHSYHKTQSMSTVFPVTDVASWPGLQGLVLMRLSTSQFGRAQLRLQ